MVERLTPFQRTPSLESVGQISPNDIDISFGLEGAFGNSQTDQAALILIRVLKERGEGWEPISIKKVQEFVEKEKPREVFCPYDLVQNGLRVTDDGSLQQVQTGDVIIDGGRITFTSSFINKTREASEKTLRRREFLTLKA